MAKMKMRAKEMIGELEDDGGTLEMMEVRLETMETLGDDGDTRRRWRRGQRQSTNG